MTSPEPVTYSFVVPIFNEEAVIPLLLHRLDALLARLDRPGEVILVDDRSSDTGPIVLAARAKSDPRYRYIRLSRNFGHQVAISAGLDAALGDAIVIMDADLQDPPEVVDVMIERWREGYQVVYAKRIRRDGEKAFKRWSADLFYRIMARLSSVEIPRDVGDFRLIDRKVLDAFRSMPEHDRFVRGMFAWLGFKQTEVAYERPPRPAGETKYPLSKMLRLAINGLVGFSDAPLRFVIWAGVGVSSLAMLFGLFVIAQWTTGSQLVEGWASTIVVLSLLCGMNMLMTGIVGLYVGRIHAEVKRRPLYVVDETVGRAASAHEQDASEDAPVNRPILLPRRLA
jgi:glycosyltransferase involved in cell wall biosynthesis